MKKKRIVNPHKNKRMMLWFYGTVSHFSILKQEEISEINETRRIQGLVSKDNSILPKIKKFRKKMKRIQRNNIDDEIPKLAISSQDPKQVNIEDKVGNVKEDLKAPEGPEEELPTNNQPIEEIVEASVGGKTRFKTPPFLLTLEILNHNVHNFLLDSGSSVNVMPLAICKKINGQPKPTTWHVTQLDRTNVKVVGEMEDVLIRLSTNEKIC